MDATAALAVAAAGLVGRRPFRSLTSTRERRREDAEQDTAEGTAAVD